jgi:metal-responsive CopG/Arc/MetJ family transcriptional regulator
MKTAISLPDTLFREAEDMAARLGIARSRLFARAVEEFIARHEQETITERLDAVYDTVAATPAPRAGLESLRELTKDDTW